jgi:hypothetical protein
LDKLPADVVAHLEHCQACRTEAHRLRATWALLNVAEPRQPSPQFSRRVWAKIAAERSGPLTDRRGGLPAGSLRGVAAAAAVILLAVVPVAVWYQAPQGRPDVVAQLELMESGELLTNLEVVADLDVLLLLDDP